MEMLEWHNPRELVACRWFSSGTLIKKEEMNNSDNANVIKSGCLLKAGKRKFQSWRKRWFVLRPDLLKYYSSPDTTNDSHLLGTLHMGEVQSIQESKDKKYSFDIILGERTYHVAAKSVEEREEWMVALQNVPAFQRKTVLYDDDSNIYAQVGESIVSDAFATTTNCAVGVYAQIQLDSAITTSDINKEMEDKQRNEAEYEVVGGKTSIPSSDSDTSDTADANESHGVKTYATPDNVLGNQENTSHPEIELREIQREVNNKCSINTASVKERSTSLSVNFRNIRKTQPRALSEGMILELEKEFPKGRRIHSLLFDLSANESEEHDTETVNQHLDEIFQGCYPLLEELDDEEEEEDDVEEEKEEAIGPFCLPPPRDGMETYAFDEIKNLIEQLEDGGVADSNSCLDVKDSNTDDYPAMKRLNAFLENI